MQKSNLDELLDRIDCASPEEIRPIMDALADRFATIWTEWDLLMLSVPKNDRQGRIRTLERTISLLSHDAEKDLP